MKLVTKAIFLAVVFCAAASSAAQPIFQHLTPQTPYQPAPTPTDNGGTIAKGIYVLPAMIIGGNGYEHVYMPNQGVLFASSYSPRLNHSPRRNPGLIGVIESSCNDEDFCPPSDNINRDLREQNIKEKRELLSRQRHVLNEIGMYGEQLALGGYCVGDNWKLYPWPVPPKCD